MGKTVKLISQILKAMLVIALIIVASLVIASTADMPNGIKLLTVQSGSMEPAIKTGSVILIKPETTYSEGDIISFKSSNYNETGTPITHRIQATDIEDDQIIYTTRGDANNTDDADPVNQVDVIGKVQLSVPSAGRIISFFKTQEGFLLGIIIPSTIIIYQELLNIKKELKKLITKKKQKPEKDSHED